MTCWVAMANIAAGWVNVGACVMAFTSVALQTNSAVGIQVGIPHLLFFVWKVILILHLITSLLCLTGVPFSLLAKGEGLGLEGYDLLAMGLAMACHSSM